MPSTESMPDHMAELLHGHSERILGLLFDHMPMGVVIFDRDYHILRYNPTWVEHLLRYTPVSLAQIRPGIAFFDLIPDMRHTLLPVFNQVLAGEPFHEEAIELIAGGIPSWWNLVLVPIPNGAGIAGILGVSTDVTAQILAQGELRREQEHTEQCVAERTRELLSLIHVQQALTSHLQATDVLQLIADESRRLTHTDVSALFLPDEAGLSLAVLSSAYPIAIQPGYRMGLENTVTGRAFVSGRMQRVDDVRADPLVDPTAIHQAMVQSILAMPLVSGRDVIGVLSVGNRSGKVLGDEVERLLTLLVPSAVIALRNVHLYEQARETAAAAERGRLARDLHDAVTQTLFSASLTAEVLPRIWQRNPDEGMKRLEKLRELTRGALAEMRILLLELRPTTLTETPLCELLRQLAQGIVGRTRIPMRLEQCDEQVLPPEVHLGFYRIAQEALNNVAKHSNANTATIAFTVTAPKVQLQVSDDGCGFDPQIKTAHHLGMSIMMERAEAIGAHLSIESTVGHGTTVSVTWNPKERLRHGKADSSGDC